MSNPIVIPNIPLPFDIPHLMHPLFAHFAIALPFIILIIALINLVAKRASLTSLNIFFLVLLSVIYLGAYLTGTADAKVVKDSLDSQTLNMLQTHKQYGIYLFYGSILVLILRLLALTQKAVFKIFTIIGMIALIAGSLATGKKGGALVYKHGVNVAMASKNISNAKSEEKEIKKEQNNENKVVTSDTNSSATKNSTQENIEVSNNSGAKEQNKTKEVKDLNESKNKDLNKSVNEQNGTNSDKITIKSENNETKPLKEVNKTQTKEHNLTKSNENKTLEQNGTK